MLTFWYVNMPNVTADFGSFSDSIAIFLGIFKHTHFHNMLLHIYMSGFQRIKLFPLTFHKIYENLMRNITYQTLKFLKNPIKQENLP